jgi:hypothetical protein
VTRADLPGPTLGCRCLTLHRREEQEYPHLTEVGNDLSRINTRFSLDAECSTGVPTSPSEDWVVPVSSFPRKARHCHS